MANKEPVKGKLIPLLEFVDWSKGNTENARALMANTVKKLGIKTTMGSLSVYIGKERDKLGKPKVARGGSVKKSERAPVIKIATRSSGAKVKSGSELDVIVNLFDEALKSLGDVREYLVEVTNENAELKQQMAAIKPLLDAIKAIK